MNELPTETLGNICSFLSEREIQQFRLVCKLFSTVAAEYVRFSMSIFMSKEGLAELYSFSAHTHLARGLRELEYSTFAMLPPSKIHRDNVARLLKFITISQEQDDILTAHYDYMCFLSTFPRFPRLRDITLRLDRRWDDQGEDGPILYKSHRNLFSDRNLFSGHNILTARDKGHALQMLLSVLAETKLKINYLTIDGLDWRFFNQSDSKLNSLFKPLANLKYLDLKIDNYHTPDLDYKDNDSAISDHDAVRDYNCCRKRMCTGVLQRCLQTLPNLEKLRLGFREFKPYSPRNFRSAPLNQIVPCGFTWTSLKVLELRCMDCERQELMELLLRHKETLRELELEEVVLRSTSWIILLDDIRRELNIKYAQIIPPLRGHFESHEEGQGIQSWSLGPNLYSLVHTYIEGGEKDSPDLKTCPLSAENCDPV
ncbi:hypothetical protein F4776DRAFT_316493 [Hypoxylon sp. NC0597]|nr:hypothetical protein F4776DRAFT_316493 [Hypoxylon sp. NC0597]